MHSIGFDYGTSHCAAGIETDAGVRLLPLEADQNLVASMLWAPDPRFELPVDAQGRLRTDTRRFQELRFGNDALARYLEDPGTGYFVKSPKSFLGTPGLLKEARARFERIVAAMMANVRIKAEAALGEPIANAIIGRPVNFQGPVGSVENDQALGMLRSAAHLAGFVAVDFLYEPLAAALEYEASLNSEQRVLVVDVGGGTTDCSFVVVGPSRRDDPVRDNDMLGHSGERLGGNDYDQALALATVVPQLGWQAELRSGLPVPNHYLVDAIATNDVNAQARFYAASTRERLFELRDDCLQPRGLERLLALQQARGSYRLLRQVETAKITLSSVTETQVDLAFVEEGLAPGADREQFTKACARLCSRLHATVAAVLERESAAPDMVYLTGGMAQSPVVRDSLRELLGELPILDSDHFTSVTEGLSIWARKRFSV
ncbi:MAG: molecular chaperone [Pseudomonadales bacterium]